jgi:hypothetical protein
MPKTRLFTLTYNNMRQRWLPVGKRYERLECEGTHYENGSVSLDTQAVFETMSDLLSQLDFQGKYKITYSDGEVRENEVKRACVSTTSIRLAHRGGFRA